MITAISLRSAVTFVSAAILSMGCLLGQQCSTAAQAGDYVMTCDGYVTIVGAATLIPTKALSSVNVSSGGTFTGTGTASLGGKILSATLSGTGTVNSNCTGSVLLTQTVGGQTAPSLSANIAVSDSGNTIDALVTVPNFVLSCRLKRVAAAQ